MAVAPAGKEREVKFLGGAAIDGAPIAYIVVMAAVITALSFIPFSVVLSSGGSFPLSQGVVPLVGWILGPIAGGIADGVGALLGVFMAPHTAGIAPLTIFSAIIAGVSGGAMVLGQKRRSWWIVLAVWFVIAWALYAGRAIFYSGVRPLIVFAEMIPIETSILLWILPTRRLFAKWIHSPNLAMVALGLFLGTWMVAGVAMVSRSMFSYWMSSWPEATWITLIPIVPMEHTFRSLTGMVIGTGVIAGLRAIGLVKPTESIY